MECAKKFSACQKKNTNKGLVSKRAAAKKRTRVAAKQKRVRIIYIQFVLSHLFYVLCMFLQYVLLRSSLSISLHVQLQTLLSKVE